MKKMLVYVASFVAAVTALTVIRLYPITFGSLEGRPPIDKTMTSCWLKCGDVPFAGFQCIMICATCTDEFGGGCQISVYY